LFQLDVEMSFVTQDDIKNLIEALLQYCWPPHLKPLSLPLPRMSYSDAIRRYGSDKPDTRYGNLVTNSLLLALFFVVLPLTLYSVTVICASSIIITTTGRP